MMNKEEDFIITKNHHRAIIDIEQFNTAQDIIKHSTKTNLNSKYENYINNSLYSKDEDK